MGDAEDREGAGNAEPEEVTGPSDDAPDVHLTVPEVHVDEISLKVEDLEAHVSLNAEVLDLLKLNVGADVRLGKVELEIKGVEAQAELEVRLRHVAAVVGRVLTTIDRNPQILEQVTKGVRSATEQLGSGGGEAVAQLGRGTGQAVESTGQGVGQALESTGQGAGQALESTGQGAGQVLESTGQGAGQALESTGEGAEEALQSTAESAGKSVEAAAEYTGRTAEGTAVGKSASLNRGGDRSRGTTTKKNSTPRGSDRGRRESSRDAGASGKTRAGSGNARRTRR